MRFDVLTIFPEIFDCFLSQSLIKKAQEKGILKIEIHDLRKWTKDHHKSVDDKPFGGGRGMVMKVEPIYLATKEIKESKKSKIILFTPRGKIFTQKIAFELAKLEQIILICGRYEGVDERVAKYIANLNLSIGNYVLMGGEIPAMVVIESVARLIPGVIGKSKLLLERMKEKGFIEYPQYTRPAVFETQEGEKWKVPKVLLEGNHKKIEEWRKKHSKIIE